MYLFCCSSGKMVELNYENKSLSPPTTFNFPKSWITDISLEKKR